MKTNTRLEWIDSLKAIAIFWIYLGHFGDNAKQLYPFVFSFHVPLFFFISGIFFKKCSSLSDLINITAKSFKRIVIPYFAFSIISLIFFSLYNNYDYEHVKELAFQILPGIRNQIFAASLWFLPCLFVMIIIHSFMQLILKNKHAVFSLCVAIFFAASVMKIGFKPNLFFNVDSALRYIVYYALGAYLSGYIKDHNAYSHNIAIKSTIYIVSIISIVLFTYVYFFGASSLYGEFKSEYLKIFSSFIITVMLFIPNILIAMRIKIRQIILIGQSTLVLCGTEQVLKTFVYSFFKMFGLKVYLHNPADTIAYTILCLFISYFTTIKIYRMMKG